MGAVAEIGDVREGGDLQISAVGRFILFCLFLHNEAGHHLVELRIESS